MSRVRSEVKLTSDDLVAVFDECVAHGFTVGQNLQLVGLELRGQGLLQSHRHPWTHTHTHRCECNLYSLYTTVLCVLYEARCVEGAPPTSDGVVVRAALQPREHGLVDQRLQVVQGLLPLSVHAAHTWGEGEEHTEPEEVF